MTPHISAPDGAFAPVVLMPGDPLRAKYIAETYLENPTLVTDVRNVLGYTGTYKGRPVSVMASGMGMPSIGIYAFELFTAYGVEAIIRIGSAGSYDETLKPRDVILATDAYSRSSFARVQSGDERDIMLPDADLNRTIIEAARRLDIPVSEGRICSSDVFYSLEGGRDWREVHENYGCRCVEMEAFALFHLAAKLGKKAACMLTISDSLVTGEELTSTERQTSFNLMMRVALEAAVTE